MLEKVFWKNETAKLQDSTLGSVTNSEASARGYNTPTQLMNFGFAIQEYVARDRAHKLESRPLFESTPKDYEDIMYISGWPKLRKQLAIEVSKNGRMYLLQVPTPNPQKPVIGLFRITRIDELGAMPSFIELESKQLYRKGDQEFIVGYRLSWNDSKEAIMERFYLDEAGEQTFIKETTYSWGKISKLPGQMFEANAMGYDDFTAAGVFGAVDHLNFHSNELTTEWKHVLTRMTNNENFSDLDAQQLSQLFHDANRIIPSSSYNNKLQEGQTIQTSGSQSITFNQLNINYIEDKILKYVGATRESTSTGANKHSLEITLQNQFATEVLMDLRDIRENDYKMFFKSLSETTGYPDVSGSIELKVSLIEEAKIALLQESVEKAKNAGSLNPKRPVEKEQEEEEEKEEE